MAQQSTKTRRLINGPTFDVGKLSNHLEAAISVYKDCLETNLAVLEEVPEDSKLGHQRTVEGFRQQIAEAEKFVEMAEAYSRVAFFHEDW